MGANTNVVSKRSMRGQSTTEFLVMGLVLVPLFFLVVYVAKYFDMKQSAHQASRYAAFERSWDPDARFKSDEDIQGEVRARFFSTKREINYKDGLAHVSNDQHVPLWTDLQGRRLLNEFSDVTLAWDKSGSLASGFNGAALNVGAGLLSLPEPNTVKALVNVRVSNVSHFEPLRSIDLTLPAATAIGAGSWSASGARSGPLPTCTTVSRLVPTSWDLMGMGDMVRSVISGVMSIFEDSELELGIIKPDLVPEGSLQQNGELSPWRNVPVDQQNGNKC